MEFSLGSDGNTIIYKGRRYRFIEERNLIGRCLNYRFVPQSELCSYHYLDLNKYNNKIESNTLSLLNHAEYVGVFEHSACWMCVQLQLGLFWLKIPLGQVVELFSTVKNGGVGVTEMQMCMKMGIALKDLVPWILENTSTLKSLSISQRLVFARDQLC